jgi:hypothetical protein
MRLIHRQTQLEDLEKCTLVVQENQLKNTDSLEEELVAVWSELIETSCALSSVIENHSTQPVSIVGFGMSVCVTDEYAQEILTSDSPYLIRDLVARWKQGDHPILNHAEIRAANKKDGVNVLGLHTIWGRAGMTDEGCAPIRDKMLDSLFSNHRGYNIKLFMKEVYGDIERDRHLAFGFTQLASYDSEMSTPEKHPYLIGLTREKAMSPAYEGRMIREFFRYTRPICTFTPADQATLQLAVTGLSETRIADILGISKNSVKSRWDSIYSHLPRQLERDLFKELTDDRQKSHALLHWLRKHSEELRPNLFFKGIDLMGDHTREA